MTIIKQNVKCLMQPFADECKNCVIYRKFFILQNEVLFLASKL